MSRWKQAALMAGTAAAIGLGGALITHGDFHASLGFTAIGLLVSFGFFLLGVLFRLSGFIRSFKRVEPYGRLLQQVAAVALLGALAYYGMARVVVAFDLWRAKRFVAGVVVPYLEEERRLSGKYPTEWRISETPPPNSPWLLRRFHYSSNGPRYSLWVMDPVICGRVAEYESTTRRWVQSFERCWY